MSTVSGCILNTEEQRQDQHNCLVVVNTYQRERALWETEAALFRMKKCHMKFKESAIAHKYLDGLRGIEIGGSAHNPFGLNTINVDKYASMDTIYKDEEFALCGERLPVDVVAEGDKLPFADKSFDFVVSSHVLEHMYDPISALLEWERVARRYIFAIVPHKDRTFDNGRAVTSNEEFLKRFQETEKSSEDTHHSVWTEVSFCNMLTFFTFPARSIVWHIDDKVGNGFMVLFFLDEELRKHMYENN